MSVLLLAAAIAFLAAFASFNEEGGAAIDLRGAFVVVPPDLTGPETRAVEMLVSEVEKRTWVRWTVAHALPAIDAPVVAVGTAAALRNLLPRHAAQLTGEGDAARPEAYQIRTVRDGGAPLILVAGADARGVLFGAGRLLRTLEMERDRVSLPADLNLATAPRTRIRGHQLGYRPKTNSYDAWDLAQWDQYIRELAVFGANSVELVPPRTDDEPDSPLFPAPQMETMVGMSGILDSYGMDCWIWYPAMDADYSDPETVEFALKEWGEVFRQLPRIDAVSVPGGDPGHTAPKHLMNLLEKEAAVLRKYHPKAQMWVAPQGFDGPLLDEFLQMIDAEPEWLDGIVFGPWVRISLPDLRARIPARYPIRHYPDITHSVRCEYPVPDWDLAFGITEARETINPRPLGEAHILRTLQSYTVGSITYSEGCNDDVNKAVWSALEWDPEVEVVDALRDYSRFFIGFRVAEGFAQGLLALERNWRPPLASNEGVETTLQQFESLDRQVGPAQRLNWRYQQALHRAHYDAYLRSRLLNEQALEERAMEILRSADRRGALTAMAEAEAVLDEAVNRPVCLDRRARAFELAEALFQSIRMQLSVTRYYGQDTDRGANLDEIDAPLNNRVWLKDRFLEIRSLSDEAERLRRLDALVRWTDPGPGGFYDEPGSVMRRDHLLTPTGVVEDPGCFRSARTGFTVTQGRVTWRRYIETLYDQPLEMRYTGLDPHAAYRLRIVYSGDKRRRVSLVANDAIEIHPLTPKPDPPAPLEFDVPDEATASGKLKLTWNAEPGLGANGRSRQVSEIWLMRL